MKSIRSKKVGRKASGAKNKQQEEHFGIYASSLWSCLLEWQLTEHQPTNQRQARMRNEIFTQRLLFFSPNTKCSQVCPGKFGVRVFGSNWDSGPWPSVLLTNSHLNTCAADWGGWLLLTQQHVDQLTCRDTSSLVWMKQDGCAHSRASEMWPACAYKSHCGGDDRLLQGHCDVPFTARPDTSKKKQTAHWWSKNTTEAFHVSQGKG